MRVIQISSKDGIGEAVDALEAARLKPLGVCSMESPESPKHQLLVDEVQPSIEALTRQGITANPIHSPLPVTRAGVLWWKNWRDSLSEDTHFDFRCQHHEEVRSVGSIIRVRRADCPAGAEPWRALADGGVDVRCEFRCHLPTGYEVHLLVPDAEEATAVLEKAGFVATSVDYRGPQRQKGISWWGEWKPALAYAALVQRPILMSFASPRVEQVPGVW